MALEHDLAVGFRLHYDQQGGTNVATTYASNGNGGFNQTASTAPAPITMQKAFTTGVSLVME